MNSDKIYQWFFTVAFTIGIVVACWAQPGNPEYNLRASTFFELDLRPISIINIENSGSVSSNISLNVTAPTEAGESFGSTSLATDDTNWLNYTSAVQTGTTRNVLVRISFGTLPDGLNLQLQAGSSATGDGTRGTPSAALTLGSTNQNLLTGIAGAYTGDGANAGHQLTYSLIPVNGDFETIFSGNTTLTITYTIIDN